jgi:hypothetical protein
MDCRLVEMWKSQAFKSSDGLKEEIENGIGRKDERKRR